MNDNRMKQLINLIESKQEIYLQDDKVVNEDAVSAEFKKFKTILDRSYLRENAGETVSSIGDVSHTVVPGAGNVVPTPLSNAGLQPNEALLIAVKRALVSGAPVNDLDFYSEVNWNLAGLGFGPQSAVMIKEAVTSLVEK